MDHLVAFVRRSDWGPNDRLVTAVRVAFDASAHDIEFAVLDDIADERRVEVRAAVVDGPSVEQLASMPSLELVQSTWAGVEAILPTVPDGVAIVRMVDPALGAMMAEAVLAWTLYLHRDMPLYARQQRDRQWVQHPVTPTSRRRVGVLGLGALGAESASVLAAHGFDVAGWSRSAKSIDGVECLSGDEALATLLARSDVVVNLLPDTPETVGLLDGAAFARMPQGASLVNFGRGATVDDPALLDALDSGHLDHAVLDVFAEEPLPDDHAYWTHPSVTVLPHVTGPTSVDTAAVIAADNVARFLTTGELPTTGLVDPTRGY